MLVQQIVYISENGDKKFYYTRHVSERNLKMKEEQKKKVYEKWK